MHLDHTESFSGGNQDRRDSENTKGGGDVVSKGPERPETDGTTKTDQPESVRTPDTPTNS
jgi:hypothetical protein